MSDPTQANGSRPDHRLIIWAPYIVFVLGILLTAISAFYLARSGESIDHKRFRNAVNATQDDIRDRMKTYITILKGGAGLFQADTTVSRRQFHDYVNSLDLQRRYPGVQGIGYSARVTPAQKDAFIAAARADGMPQFTIWPSYPRGIYHAVLYLEPMDHLNETAIGYDMFTDPAQREAMAEARDSGQPAASGKVTLVQEIDHPKQAGFLIYVPVYRGGMAHATVSERRASLQGFVYSPFRADDLLRQIVSARANSILGIEIFDGPDLTPEHRLRSSRIDLDRGYHPLFSTIETLDVAGRTWSLVYTTRPEFDLVSQRNALWFALVGGVMFSFLLFAFLRSQVQARATAETLARNLGASEEALRRANRAKDDFLATLSHELRTPLGTVLIWSHLLREGKLDPIRRDRAVEMIERSTKTLVQLIDDLLDVSRIIAGKLSVESRPLELSYVVRAAIETAQPQADAKGIRLEYAAASPMGQVSGDPGRLQQVVSNLLSNAIKFTPSGGRVSVHLDMQGSSARISVTDTGQGISTDFLPYIFDRFRQADSTSTRSFSGLGLGLAIVRHIVDLHGGTVTAKSEGKDRGSTFTVKIPLLRTKGRPAAGAGEQRRPAAARRPLRGVHVLVVDDEDSVREALMTVLEQSGAEVTAVGSAREALEAVRHSKPDVLLSDIAMPNEDGYGLMRELRALQSADGGDIPAAALTAYATAEDRSKALRAGYQAHVSKPFDPDQLVSIVAGLVHKRFRDMRAPSSSGRGLG